MVKSPSYALVDSKQSRLFDMDGNFPIPINIVILFPPISLALRITKVKY